MNGWQQDKKWADRFMSEIKAILGQHLITESPIIEDQKHNTDLIVLNLANVRISCRIRKYYYFTKYPDDITIRSKRLQTENETELTKIIEGDWGDYLFYGFSDEEEKKLHFWTIVSLKSFRRWYIKKHETKEVPHITKKNKDNSSEFTAFDLRKLPTDVIFKQCDKESQHEKELQCEKKLIRQATQLTISFPPHDHP